MVGVSSMFRTREILKPSLGRFFWNVKTVRGFLLAPYQEGSELLLRVRGTGPSVLRGIGRHRTDPKTRRPFHGGWDFVTGEIQVDGRFGQGKFLLSRVTLRSTYPQGSTGVLEGIYIGMCGHKEFGHRDGLHLFTTRNK